MSHEISQTIERGGRFYNVHGTTGDVLPPRYDFERESYETLDEALLAARERSRRYREPESPSGPSGLERLFEP